MCIHVSFVSFIQNFEPKINLKIILLLYLAVGMGIDWLWIITKKDPNKLMTDGIFDEIRLFTINFFLQIFTYALLSFALHLTKSKKKFVPFLIWIAFLCLFSFYKKKPENWWNLKNNQNFNNFTSSDNHQTKFSTKSKGNSISISFGINSIGKTHFSWTNPPPAHTPSTHEHQAHCCKKHESNVRKMMHSSVSVSPIKEKNNRIIRFYYFALIGHRRLLVFLLIPSD